MRSSSAYLLDWEREHWIDGSNFLSSQWHFQFTKQGISLLCQEFSCIQIIHTLPLDFPTRKLILHLIEKSNITRGITNNLCFHGSYASLCSSFPLDVPCFCFPTYHFVHKSDCHCIVFHHIHDIFLFRNSDVTQNKRMEKRKVFEGKRAIY